MNVGDFSMNTFNQVDHGIATGCKSRPVLSRDVENTAFEPLIDSREAAALLRIHPKTLQKLARKGKVDAVRIGKLWRFRASALNRWLEEIAR